MNSVDFIKDVKTIAIIGLSDKPDRASYQVAEFLISRGFRIIPVNPMIREVFGLKAYPDLSSVPQDIVIDMIDIFRKSEEVMPIVMDSISRNIKHIWMQEGVLNLEAAKYAQEHGATVAVDVCLMKAIKALL